MTKNDLQFALSDILRQHPRETRSQHQRRWRLAVASDAALIEAAADFFFRLNYNPVATAVLGAVSTAPARGTSVEQWNANVAEIKAAIVGQLLELMTPHGKPLGDCTGAECASLRGFFKRVADRVPTGELVRDHLNNEELRILWRQRPDAPDAELHA